MNLFIREIKEDFSRENFLRIERESKDNVVRKGNFKFFELVLNSAVTELPLKHGLNFQPLDVILLSVRSPDTATVTWHYDSFTRENIVVSTSAACTIRAYIGRYRES